jgi:hypothetical protein
MQLCKELQMILTSGPNYVIFSAGRAVLCKQLRRELCRPR